MTRYLGIDYGLERTGLAISDREGKMAFPLTTLSLKEQGNRKNLLAALADIARANGAEALVMGLPLHADGSENEMVRIVRNIATRIRRRLPLPFYWMPEALTSEEARHDLVTAGLSGRELKQVLDQQAACRILSCFLNQPQHLRMSA